MKITTKEDQNKEISFWTEKHVHEKISKPLETDKDHYKITKNYISKLKIRYTKLTVWIIVITLLFEKRLRQSMIDKKRWWGSTRY